MKTIYLLCIISSFINGVFVDEVNSVSVMEGDSLTLHTDTKLQTEDLILWRFKDVNYPIATLDRADNTISYNGTFRDRLKLSTQTGDLTIINISTENSGVYQLEIRRENVITKIFDVTGVSIEQKSVSVVEEDSVSLYTNVPDIKKYDEIRWRFQQENSTLPVQLVDLIRKAPIISTNEVSKEGFKDRLHLNVQTGDLTIRNIRSEHCGLYEVDIISCRRHTIHKSFRVALNGKETNVSVIKGNPVTLYTKIELETYDVINWRSNGGLIAEIYKPDNLFNTFDGADGKFKDKLKLDEKTGDLTIKDVTTQHSGLYELKINSQRRSIHYKYIITVSEKQGLSRSAMVGLTVFIILLIAAAAAAGVIYYRHKIKEAMKQMGEIKTLKVNEGKSVNLKTEVKDIKRDDVIEWRFEETLIAEINPANNIFSTYNGDDDEFRDKLELNRQTGDLNINDIKEENTGVYKLKIIRGGETSYKRFSVHVRSPSGGVGTDNQQLLNNSSQQQ